METHPIKQAIEAVTVWNGNSDKVEFGAYEPEAYRVGHDGVTRIEACEKPGEYGMLPYVRVWRDDACFAEFSQHKIVGVYFDPDRAAPAPEVPEFDEVPEVPKVTRLDPPGTAPAPEFPEAADPDAPLASQEPI